MENMENLKDYGIEAWVLKKDYKKAMDYFHQAAEQGDKEALLYIGEMAQEIGNYEKAMDCFRQLAKYDNTTAFFYVGKLYENENYAGYDRGKAIKWYKKAANAGDSRAVLALAVMGRKDLQRKKAMRDRQCIWHW